MSVFFRHGFPEVNNVYQGEKVEQRSFVINDLELASFTGGELEEGDIRPFNRDAEIGSLISALVSHQIASFKFITVQ